MAIVGHWLAHYSFVLNSCREKRFVFAGNSILFRGGGS